MKSTTKRVLFVAYLFPPVGGAGVQRAAKFVKYLPQFGWDVTVLTAENPSVPVFDESLLADIPPQTTIVRAKTLEPSYALKKVVSAASRHSSPGQPTASPNRWKQSIRKLLRATANAALQPDPQILWHHHAVDTGLRILSESRHDAIVVTAPPFSSLLVGAELSRRTGLPLVLDYRDEWDISNSYWENKRQGLFSHWLQRRQQRAVVRSAAALIATTRHSAAALASLASHACDADKTPIVTHIYNGYDAADFQDVEPLCVGDSASPTLDHEDHYKLAYVGTLWNLTSVEPLVSAVSRLCQAAPDLASRLELHFAGRRTESQDQLLDRLNGLPCHVVRHPYLDHDAALQLMRTADGLCLLLSDVPHADRVVPAKLFEYMALRKPLLAITPPGEVSELLADCPFGLVHAPSDIAGIAQRLGDEIERHRLGIPIPCGLWNPQQFERRHQAEQLAQLLNTVANRDRNSVSVTPQHERFDESNTRQQTIELLPLSVTS